MHVLFTCTQGLHSVHQAGIESTAYYINYTGACAIQQHNNSPRGHKPLLGSQLSYSKSNAVPLDQVTIKSMQMEYLTKPHMKFLRMQLLV